VKGLNFTWTGSLILLILIIILILARLQKPGKVKNYKKNMGSNKAGSRLC